jgi:hypothetical protein
MKISMSDQGVPFVVTYRKWLRRPKVTQTTRFVGVRQLLKNAWGMAASVIHDLAYEQTNEVKDPGKSVVVHWAIQVEDPWDIAPGREANLVAYRMMGDRPPCGAHFEIISVAEQEAEQPSGDVSPEELQSGNGAGRVKRVSEHSSQPSIMHPHSFIRPPAPAYAPRVVEPLVDSLIGEPDAHTEDGEAPPDLEGASSIGEDH